MITQNNISNFPLPVIAAINYINSFLSGKSGEKYKIYLYGSQLVSPNHNKDFDIGFQTQNSKISFREYALLKQKVEDIAFPYRVDLKNLNSAPDWFRESALSNFMILNSDNNDQFE
jgi:hypothetical protein